MEKLIKDFEFLKEIDKMKTIDRMTSVIGLDRRENDAEHSWHIAVMALVLKDYIDYEIDLLRVVEMLLIHDLVEIYAGDTFAYDTEGYKDKLEREKRAADKIFGILDNPKSIDFKEKWVEFEEMKTKEALFANAVDRLQPILNNFYNQGGTWIEHGIKKDQVLKRIAPIESISKILYSYAVDLIDRSVELGYIKE